MVQEDLVSVSSKRWWPCVVAENGGSVGQPAHPNNFHTTELCSLKTQELVCIYTARSSRPPAGCSWWVWIGPLTLWGALELDAEGSETLLPHTPSGVEADAAPIRLFLICPTVVFTHARKHFGPSSRVSCRLEQWRHRLNSPAWILNRSPQQYELKRIEIKSN